MHACGWNRKVGDSMRLRPTPVNGPANDQSHPAFGKLHLSTVIFLVLLFAALLLTSIPGQIVLTPYLFTPGQCGPDFRQMSETCRHGWPWPFLVREGVVAGVPPAWRLSLWNLTEGVVSLNWAMFAADLGVWLLCLLIGGVVFERWRRRRRRLFQFYLIDIMAVFLVVACGLSYWAANAQCHVDQEKIVEQIRQLQAENPFDWAVWTPGGPTWLRRVLGDRPFAPLDRVIGLEVDGRAIPRLSGLHTLKVLTVSETISNRQLDHAAGELPELEALDLDWDQVARESKEEQSGYDECYLRIPRLSRLRGLNLYQIAFRGDGLEQLKDVEVLDLTDTDIADEAMPKLAGLCNLKDLSLTGTNVTNTGLRHLSRLDKLESLGLGCFGISDAGLQHLKGLKQLSVLDLHGAQITDEGLKDLAGLSKLRLLDLSSTAVTVDGVRRLQRALPRCRIQR